MALVSLSHVAKRYDGPLLIDGATLDIESGAKIGIIGRNGAGKSTLLKMIEGSESPSGGEVFKQRGTRIAYLAQELDAPPERPVIEEMRQVFAEDFRRAERLTAIEEALTHAEGTDQERLVRDYARLEEEHRAAGGDQVERRIDEVLTGLGLPEASRSEPIGVFSGGERNLIALARILLAKPDLVLLDEPSNHLDLDGLEWFIRWVRRSSEAMVMISHDRHLLDAVATEIWEFEHAQVKRWAGNYTDYTIAKADWVALQERRYKNQQKLIERLEFQARRLRDMARAYDDPGQAKRAKALMARIERMDKVEKPTDDMRSFSGRMGGGDRHGHFALRVDRMELVRGERVLLDGAELEITWGERLCIVGPNGSGKSSFIQDVLTRARQEDDPVVRLGSGVRVGEYRQFHEEALNARESLLDWVMRATGLGQKDGAALLHRFRFAHEDLERPIATLSGGEKSRLQLARLQEAKVNLLILDEPTNHLDIPSAEELERMLSEYEGTLVIISHDRWFLDGLVNRVIEIRDRRLVPFRGSVTEWWEARRAESGARGFAELALESRRKAGADEASAAKDAKRGAIERSKAERQAEREARKERQRQHRKLSNRVSSAEREIADLESEKERLEGAVAAAYADGGDPTKGARLGQELGVTETRLAEALESWEAAAAALEELDEAARADAAADDQAPTP